MFSFAMTTGLASDSDKFKIIITLRRVQKFGDTRDPTKISIFCLINLTIYTYHALFLHSAALDHSNVQ